MCVCYLKESQNLLTRASSLTTSLPEVGLFFTKAPTDCPTQRSTKVRVKSETGSRSDARLIHSGELKMIESGGEHKASTALTLPRWS